jgi:hypothetical protein
MKKTIVCKSTNIVNFWVQILTISCLKYGELSLKVWAKNDGAKEDDGRLIIESLDHGRDVFKLLRVRIDLN